MFNSFLSKTAKFRLSREEELELVREYQKTGDDKVLRKLKLSLRPLLRNIASRANSSDGDVSLSQLYIRADRLLPGLLKKYDENNAQGAQLHSYLTSHLQGHMMNAVSDNQLGPHVPRPEHNKLHNYQQAKYTAELEFGNNPTPEQLLEIEPRLNSVDEINRISQYHKELKIGDALHGNEDDGFLQYKDQFTQREFDQNDRLRSLQMDNLKQLMNELNPQERKIIEEYVFNEKSMANVALTLGLSSSQVRSSVTKWRTLVKERGLGEI